MPPALAECACCCPTLTPCVPRASNPVVDVPVLCLTNVVLIWTAWSTGAQGFWPNAHLHQPLAPQTRQNGRHAQRDCIEDRRPPSLFALKAPIWLQKVFLMSPGRCLTFRPPQDHQQRPPAALGFALNATEHKLVATVVASETL